MTAFLVHQFIEDVAARAPEQTFVIQQGGRFSYGDINAGANRCAQLLIECGLEHGDRVALLAHNSHQYVEAYYGILKAGGIAVPLNTASDVRMLVRFLADSGAEILIVGSGMDRLVHHAGDELAGLRVLIAPNPDRLKTLPASVMTLSFEQVEARSAEPPAVELSGDDVASIIYTSGSTGRPRGAALTHGNIVANTRSIVSHLGLGSSDRVLVVLPLYYVYGKSLLNTHALVGGSVVLENRFRYANTALDTLETEACTGLSGVPSTFAILLNRSNFADRKLLHLRYVTQAGGGMSPALTRRLMATLPTKQIFVMYGATEASARLSYLPPDELPQAVGSIGRAIDGVELRVLRADGREAAVDELGELVARGPNIMRGYWEDPEETARVLDEAGYHTGDLARRDARGLFFIVGRKKDMIKVGGHRIAAKEIEDAILEHEDIHEVAVIGVPDELLGESAKAVIVLREGGRVDAEGLARFLNDRVPAYKIPKVVEFRSELPKNESGKIMKMVLREEAERSAESS